MELPNPTHYCAETDMKAMNIAACDIVSKSNLLQHVIIGGI